MKLFYNEENSNEISSWSANFDTCGVLFFGILSREMGFLIPLSLAIPSPAISMANRIVTEATSDGKKCRLYKKYNLEEWCLIGQYACNHCMAAATCYFLR